MANGLLVPMQAIIILIVFFWSLTREYAGVGIKFMFTADWCKFIGGFFDYSTVLFMYFHSAALLNPKLYVEAACQNGFDTAAGMGLLSAYAAYFSRNTGAVRYGVFLPTINNLAR